MSDLRKLTDEELLSAFTLTAHGHEILFGGPWHDIDDGKAKDELLRRLSLHKWHRFDDPDNPPPKDARYMRVIFTDGKHITQYAFANSTHYMLITPPEPQYIACPECEGLGKVHDCDAAGCSSVEHNMDHKFFFHCEKCDGYGKLNPDKSKITPPEPEDASDAR